MVTKVFAVCACPDTFARSSLQNHIRLNGFYGCSWCLHPGKFLQNQVRYITTNVPSTLRSDHTIREDALAAIHRGNSVHGVKGPSCLFNLPGFDQSLGYVPDYMHCVCLGVAKMMAELWFATKNHAEAYYIGQKRCIQTVNARLMKIVPPRAITRLPRPISARREWKASEWRARLLFYSLACLSGLLESRFLEHFSLLSCAIYILLQDSMTLEDIDKAETAIRIRSRVWNVVWTCSHDV